MNRTAFFLIINTALLRGVALRGAAFGVLAAVITQPVLAADASSPNVRVSANLAS
jgi:hypothetical protein